MMKKQKLKYYLPRLFGLVYGKQLLDPVLELVPQLHRLHNLHSLAVGEDSLFQLIVPFHINGKQSTLLIL